MGLMLRHLNAKKQQIKASITEKSVKQITSIDIDIDIRWGTFYFLLLEKCVADIFIVKIYFI